MDAVSSLDHRPITVENLASDDAEQEYVHKRWEYDRRKWSDVLRNKDADAKHRERFHQCGKNAWVHKSRSTGRMRVVSDSCKLRICPRCQHIAANRLRRRLESALSARAAKHWKLITLTQRSTTAPLRTQIANLKSAFRRLRQRQAWKKRVQGGYAVLEITLNPKTLLWHPHLHIVADASFFEQKTLSVEWCRASRGSKIVDIRVIQSEEKAIEYVSRYMTKVPENLHVSGSDKAFELYQSMKGQRYLIAFGNVPRPEPTAPDPTEPQDWEPFARVSELIADARAGNPWAKMILNAIQTKDQDHGNDEIPHATESKMPLVHGPP